MRQKCYVVSNLFRFLIFSISFPHPLLQTEEYAVEGKATALLHYISLTAPPRLVATWDANVGC